MRDNEIKALIELNKDDRFSSLSLEQLVFESVRSCGIEDVYQVLGDTNFDELEKKYKKLRRTTEIIQK